MFCVSDCGFVARMRVTSKIDPHPRSPTHAKYMQCITIPACAVREISQLWAQRWGSWRVRHFFLTDNDNTINNANITRRFGQQSASSMKNLCLISACVISIFYLCKAIHLIFLWRRHLVVPNVWLYLHYYFIVTVCEKKKTCGSCLIADKPSSPSYFFYFSRFAWGLEEPTVCVVYAINSE